MVRLRRGWRNEIGRKRDRSRPLPEGMSLQELAAKAGVTLRTLRYYLEKKVVPAPQFRGTATRYGREQLLHLMLADRLRRERRMKLDAIRRRLAELSLADIEVELGLAPPRGEPADSVTRGAKTAQASPPSGRSARYGLGTP